MKWLLVAIVMNTPVKTDLIFNNLSSCLIAEEEMRKQWTIVYNQERKNNASEETLKLVQSQLTSGTCIPTK